MELTSRERINLALNHKETDRVPFSLGFSVTQPAMEDLQSYIGHNSIHETVNYIESFNDLKWIFVPYTGDAFKNRNENGMQYDYWNVGRKLVSYGRGSYYEIFEYPLANITSTSDLKNFEWPKADWFDFSAIKDIVAKTNAQSNGKNEFAFRIGTGTIFENSWYLRGFENFFMDLLAEPEIANDILTKVTDFFVEYFTKALTAADGLIDITFVGDDISGQDGPLISKDIYKEMIKPHHKRLYDRIHQFPTKTMFHSDGAVQTMVPEIMDAGVDILEALQFDAKGMDAQFLKDNYGDKLCFHGGISVQSTLPFKKPSDVIDEVNERFRVLAKKGGYIMAPSHAVQGKTPPENIVAMFETAMKCKF